jgi:two-component system phosphate regulon response regulator OmpR
MGTESGADAVREGASIVVVDDDPAIREMLVEYLGGQGYRVRAAGAGDALRALLDEAPADLVLLDIALPGEDGLSLARHLRENHATRVIMVTASADVVDRIVGLEMGADDYLPKPFDPRELLARIKSVLRRRRPPQAVPGGTHEVPVNLRFGRCVLEVATHRLLDEAGIEQPLTRMEYDLLVALGSHPNRVLSRDRIMQLTCNRDWDPDDRSIDIRIARLRRRVEPDPTRPRILRTVRGAGYMYVPE